MHHCADRKDYRDSAFDYPHGWGNQATQIYDLKIEEIGVSTHRFVRYRFALLVDDLIIYFDPSGVIVQHREVNGVIL